MENTVADYNVPMMNAAPASDLLTIEPRQQAADWFKRKRPQAEEPAAAKRTGSRRRS